jgi:major histocompatibility complex class I
MVIIAVLVVLGAVIVIGAVVIIGVMVSFVMKRRRNKGRKGQGLSFLIAFFRVSSAH